MKKPQKPKAPPSKAPRDTTGATPYDWERKVDDELALEKEGHWLD